MIPWDELFDLYFKGCNETTAAHAERLHHMTRGLRRLAVTIDLPEFHKRAHIGLVARQDWSPTPEGLHSIDWITNSATGTKLFPEPEGDRGRARYFETGEDRPPIGELGSVLWYIRKGNEIWWRDTPDAAGSFPIRYRFIPSKLTETDLDVPCPVQPNYQDELVELAIASYFKFHPPTRSTDTGTIIDRAYARDREASALADLQTPQSPTSQENLDRRDRVFQRGYCFDPGGR